ncbi:hypothetical protein GMOD_00008469 [Pyrenophora seminiperda CCB06]|uniref:Uncharacterized protein n=1 Tax=Pyrenophora seminiperda CCB06 TaxID=1302712 RepID=A0A3M7M8J6_9PLEO|nr:hypothetical protein GMOD_00008469 [Pyrenophora seminiperda CCB06]
MGCGTCGTSASSSELSSCPLPPSSSLPSRSDASSWSSSSSESLAAPMPKPSSAISSSSSPKPSKSPLTDESGDSASMAFRAFFLFNLRSMISSTSTAVLLFFPDSCATVPFSLPQPSNSSTKPVSMSPTANSKSLAMSSFCSTSSPGCGIWSSSSSCGSASAGVFPFLLSFFAFLDATSFGLTFKSGSSVYFRFLPAPASFVAAASSSAPPSSDTSSWSDMVNTKSSSRCGAIFAIVDCPDRYRRLSVNFARRRLSQKKVRPRGICAQRIPVG